MALKQIQVDIEDFMEEFYEVDFFIELWFVVVFVFIFKFRCSDKPWLGNLEVLKVVALVVVELL